MTEPTSLPSQGNAKYAIVGIALLAAAGLGYCAMSQEPPPAPAQEDRPDAAAPRPSTALTDDSLFIPEEVPDAWSEVPDSGPVRRASNGGGGWECTGAVANAQSVVASSRQQFQSCYERRLKAQPTLQGNVRVQMRVDSNGRVGAVQVDGSLRDREVFACIRSVASRLQFDRVSGASCAVLAAPFNFSPQN